MTDLNPMSTVDISVIEERMKMSQLDQLRGYAQNHYGEVHQYKSTEYVPQSQAAGYQILREPLWNKGELHRYATAHVATGSPSHDHLEPAHWLT
jgi:hypothetical protein